MAIDIFYNRHFIYFTLAIFVIYHLELPLTLINFPVVKGMSKNSVWSSKPRCISCGAQGYNNQINRANQYTIVMKALKVVMVVKTKYIPVSHVLFHIFF